MPIQTDGFAGLLASYRQRTGRSRNALAHEVGVDPSYLTRVEHGEREAPRVHIVDGLARALRLPIRDWDQLRVAGGYAPKSLEHLGEWPEVMSCVSEVLRDIHLPDEEREEFCQVVSTICKKWRHPEHTPLAKHWGTINAQKLGAD